MWLTGRRKRQRLRRNGGHVPPAGKGRGGADANGSARGRLDAQDADETAGAGAGRYPDQASHPVAADGSRRPRRTSRAGRERSAAGNRSPQTCQPRGASTPPAGRPLRRAMAARAGRARTQSSDCGGRGRPRRRALRKGKHGWVDAPRTLTGTTRQGKHGKASTEWHIRNGIYGMADMRRAGGSPPYHGRDGARPSQGRVSGHSQSTPLHLFLTQPPHHQSQITQYTNHKSTNHPITNHPIHQVNGSTSSPCTCRAC